MKGAAGNGRPFCMAKPVAGKPAYFDAGPQSKIYLLLHALNMGRSNTRLDGVPIMTRNLLFSAAFVTALVAAAPASAATIILNGDGFRIPPAADGTGPGDSSSTVTAPTGQGRVTSLILTLENLRHNEAGDLQFLLSHAGQEINFANFFGAREDDDPDPDADLNGTYRIFDAASIVFQNAPGDPIPSGDYRPNGANLFSTFNGAAAAGDWTLTIRDRLASDSGRLGSWRLQIETDRVVAAVPEPSTWAMLILGFGLTGGAMRRRRQDAVRFAF